MNRIHLKGIMLGLAAGVALATTANLVAQQAQPVKGETQFFVTGEGDDAHLWVREGTNLRCVGHGECKAHGDHEGHDHAKEGKKP